MERGGELLLPAWLDVMIADAATAGGGGGGGGGGVRSVLVSPESGAHTAFRFKFAGADRSQKDVFFVSGADAALPFEAAVRAALERARKLTLERVFTHQTVPTEKAKPGVRGISKASRAAAAQQSQTYDVDFLADDEDARQVLPQRSRYEDAPLYGKNKVGGVVDGGAGGVKGHIKQTPHTTMGIKPDLTRRQGVISAGTIPPDEPATTVKQSAALPAPPPAAVKPPPVSAPPTKREQVASVFSVEDPCMPSAVATGTAGTAVEVWEELDDDELELLEKLKEMKRQSGL